MKQLLIIMMTILVGFHNPLEENFQRTIKGKVIGADDGLPLPQVAVFLKGTQKGTSTDINGAYSLQIPATGGVLVFRYLGFVTQEVKIGKKQVIDVALQPDVTALGEVVVTGIASRRSSRKVRSQVSPLREMEDSDVIRLNRRMSKQMVYFNEYRPVRSNESYARIEKMVSNLPGKILTVRFR